MKDQTAEAETKQELGRRLFAAYLSYRMRLKSLDYTLKNHVGDDPVDPSWGELGWNIMTAHQEKLVAELCQTGKGKGKQDWTTEKVIQKHLEKITDASVNGMVMKIVSPFTGAPPPTGGLLVAFVSCPDEIVKDLDAKLNKVIDETFDNHGYNLQPSPPRVQ